MIANDPRHDGSSVSSARPPSAATPASGNHLVLCAVFQDLAQDWLELWCVERGEGLNGEESQRIARLHERILVIAQIIFEMPPCDRRQLEATLDLAAFFDARQPWIVAGRFEIPFDPSSYTTAVTMLASLLVHELKGDPWSVIASRLLMTSIN